jgi:hypothetical protein
MGGDREYMVAKEIRDGKRPRAVAQNSRDQIRFNTITMRALDSCFKVKTDFLAFQPLTPTRIAVDHVIEGTTGCVPLKRSKSEKTGIVSFGPVLAEHSELKVEKGRTRLIPWTVETDPKRFILELDQQTNVPVPPRAAKKVSEPKTNPINV